MSGHRNSTPQLAAIPPILESSQAIDVVTDVGDMYLHRADEVITPTLLATGSWEPQEAAFLRRVLRPGANFLDVGANVGYFTLMASAIVGSSGRVIAVEPESRNLDLLRANVWRSRATNVEVLPVAAAAETGYLGLRLSETNRGDHQVVDASSHTGVLVPAARLDELLAGLSIDIVKIDVQGVDHEVVEGLAGLLAENSESVLMCEFWLTGMEERGVDPSSVIARYRQLGYQVSLLGSDGEAFEATSDQILHACHLTESRFVNLVLASVSSGKRSLVSEPAFIEQPPTNQPQRWDPIFYSGWERFIPERPMWVGPNDPVVHFLRWPFEYLAYLTLLCELKRDDSVLEIGCNHGRTMLALLDYLRPPGRYEGLDILAPHIAYARDHIQAFAPSFRFTLADIYNDLYNPGGSIDAASYEFPYPEASFDCAYAASVYTHLLPSATANYLRQTRRVLKPGARCLFSFFVLDFYGGPGSSADPLYEFDGRIDGMEGVGFRDVQVPGAVVAYEREYIDRLAADARLRVTRVIPGSWSARGNYAVNEQDLVVLEAVERRHLLPTRTKKSGRPDGGSVT